MKKEFDKVAVIAGAGPIGLATAVLLTLHKVVNCIYIFDREAAAVKRATKLMTMYTEFSGHAFVVPDGNITEELHKRLEEADILLDCVPGDAAPQMARLALQYHLHYANLTEYVLESEQIRQMAEGAETAFVLQTGLAPGYITVAGKALLEMACDAWGVNLVERLIMRVGALAKDAPPPFYYGFTWSPAGVATEYLEDSIVIRDGRQAKLPSLSSREIRYVNGVRYEEALTSGGAADLPEALTGRVLNLDYKTLRYPGHYSYIDQLIKTLPPNENCVQSLQDAMEQAIPYVEDDIVVLHVAVEDTDAGGNRRSFSQSVTIEPIQLGGIRLKAIQATTAASLVEVTRLILNGGFKGIVFQSMLPTDFLHGPIVTSVYGPFHPSPTLIGDAI